MGLMHPSMDALVLVPEEAAGPEEIALHLQMSQRSITSITSQLKLELILQSTIMLAVPLLEKAGSRWKKVELARMAASSVLRRYDSDPGRPAQGQNGLMLLDKYGRRLIV